MHKGLRVKIDATYRRRKIEKIKPRKSLGLHIETRIHQLQYESLNPIKNRKVNHELIEPNHSKLQ